MILRNLSTCALLLALGRCVNAGVNSVLFTYYEIPLEGLDPRGPSFWSEIEIHESGGGHGSSNQCGGNGQTTGFGQSPIAIPKENAEQCDTDLSGFTFMGGNCAWDDLTFSVTTNGVMVTAKSDKHDKHYDHDDDHSSCTLGKMKIPGNDHYFEATELRINTISEHSVDGKFYSNELQLIHVDHDSHSVAVFAAFIDVDEESPNTDHEALEPFLMGWEAYAKQSEEFCAVKPSGTEIFSPSSILESKQLKMSCPQVASGIDADDVIMDGDYPEFQLDLPNSKIPNIYEGLAPSVDGIYSYRGSLTTPPCKENAHWNILEKPILLSKSQVDRLYALILCYVERSSCKHATVANQFGGTNRPPQPLSGRTIIHRCKNGDNTEGEALEVPLPPTFDVDHEDGESGPWVALLFPWFISAIGLFVYYLLSRYIHALPYTAVMFLLGTFMGIGIVIWEQTTDQLSVSTRMWGHINAELLLLGFLPGLLFRDAYGLNFHLFRQSIFQCLTLAFPMVLAGTTLLACVGFFLLPYGWSFSLAMTFGSILSATDPVAVSALLNEVGAPPRLKMHIAGESLLNDGSAIVFFTIFSSKFLFENHIPSHIAGLADIDLATGVALFFKMSLGAVAIGLAFALLLNKFLFYLHKRFNHEESIVQVTATITVAYLTFYIAEPVSGTSGVIAVVTCGIFTKAYGSAMINDQVMMDKFWTLVEHLLNTVIFALGGVVWGMVISNSDPERMELFTVSDWGYLGVVYVLMLVIRTGLMFACLPLISRIGLKSDWKECLFLSWGGLRGAVGIALAIALDSEVIRDTLPGDPTRNYTSQLFGLTGGIAFMTLVINGTTCGPLLRKLGLADVSEARTKVTERYGYNLMHRTLDRLFKLLGDSRFTAVDVGVVQKYVPYINDVPFDELKRAVKRNKGNTPPHSYMKPNLESFRPLLSKDEFEELEDMAHLSMKQRFHSLVSLASVVMPDDIVTDGRPSEEALIELRRVFIELVRSAYDEQIRKGELNSREGLVVFGLNQSLELASDAVAHGSKLCDWKVLTDNSVYEQTIDKGKSMRNVRIEMDLTEKELKYEESKIEIIRTMAFIEAHNIAQDRFKEDFCGGHGVPEAERIVLQESRDQVTLAEESMTTLKKADREVIVSHFLCEILLNNAATFVGELIEQGLLREQEGEEYFHEIEHSLEHVGDTHVEMHKDWKSISKRMTSSVRKSMKRIVSSTGSLAGLDSESSTPPLNVIAAEAGAADDSGSNNPPLKVEIPAGSSVPVVSTNIGGGNMDGDVDDDDEIGIQF